MGMSHPFPAPAGAFENGDGAARFVDAWWRNFQFVKKRRCAASRRRRGGATASRNVGAASRHCASCARSSAAGFFECFACAKSMPAESSSTWQTASDVKPASSPTSVSSKASARSGALRCTNVSGRKPSALCSRTAFDTGSQPTAASRRTSCASDAFRWDTMADT